MEIDEHETAFGWLLYPPPVNVGKRLSSPRSLVLNFNGPPVRNNRTGGEPMRIRNLLKTQRGKQRAPADWLVVGLGNPGVQYTGNRHNVGFWTLRELAQRWKAQIGKSGASMQLGVASFEGQRVALCRPLTFMNASGKAVNQALQFTGCDTAHTIVVYDDLDLPVGALRIREGGGHGGNNGLRSIVGLVGGEFIRVRIGIGRPEIDGKPTREPETIAAYVLSDPRADERVALQGAVADAAAAVEAIILEGADAAGNRYNRKSAAG